MTSRSGTSDRSDAESCVNTAMEQITSIFHEVFRRYELVGKRNFGVRSAAGNKNWVPPSTPPAFSKGDQNHFLRRTSRSEKDANTKTSHRIPLQNPPKRQCATNSYVLKDKPVIKHNENNNLLWPCPQYAYKNNESNKIPKSRSSTKNNENNKFLQPRRQYLDKNNENKKSLPSRRQDPYEKQQQKQRSHIF